MKKCFLKLLLSTIVLAILFFGATLTKAAYPLTSSIVPESKQINSPGFTMLVNGSNFTPSSIVRFEGSDRPTTFFSDTELTVQIPDTDLTTVGFYKITVSEPDTALCIPSGKLKITKVIVGAAEDNFGDFNFSVSPTPYSFILNADADSSVIYSYTIDDLDPYITYTIYEEPQDGWELVDAWCEAAINSMGDTAIVDLENYQIYNIPVHSLNVTSDGEAATTSCFFFNQKVANPPPTSSYGITVNKTTIGGDGNFDFVANGPDLGPISFNIATVSGFGSYYLANLTHQGEYKIEEIVPSGWAKLLDNCFSVYYLGSDNICDVKNEKTPSASPSLGQEQLTILPIINPSNQSAGIFIPLDLNNPNNPAGVIIQDPNNPNGPPLGYLITGPSIDPSNPSGPGIFIPYDPDNLPASVLANPNPDNNPTDQDGTGFFIANDPNNPNGPGVWIPYNPYNLSDPNNPPDFWVYYWTDFNSFGSGYYVYYDPSNLNPYYPYYLATPPGGIGQGTLKIVKNIAASGGNGVFSYYTSSTPIVAIIDTSVNDFADVSLDGGTYSIYESLPDDSWLLNSVSCDKTFTPITGGVNVEIVAGKTTTCAFNNEKIFTPPPLGLNSPSKPNSAFENKVFTFWFVLTSLIKNMGFGDEAIAQISNDGCVSNAQEFEVTAASSFDYGETTDDGETTVDGEATVNRIYGSNSFKGER